MKARSLLTSHLVAISIAAGCDSTSPPIVVSPFGKFEGRVVAEWADDNRNMTLTRDFAYIDASGKRWTAPKGTVVDGASIPKVFWSVIGSPFEGPYRNASVVHDIGCEEQTESWEDVHRMFHDACRCGGASSQKAKMLYWAVYNFGPRWPAPGEPRLYGLRVEPSPVLNEEMARRAAEYFEEHDPSLDEIERLSTEGGPLELGAAESPAVSDETAN